jgi:uncharacterized spore protein YtfJ
MTGVGEQRPYGGRRGAMAGVGEQRPYGGGAAAMAAVQPVAFRRDTTPRGAPK